MDDPLIPVRHRVHVHPAGLDFDAGEQESVLMAALAAGWRMASACRNGTCRRCICRLRSGAVDYLIDWPGLSAQEKAEGWILPCVAVARSELVLDQPIMVSMLTGATAP